MSRFTLSPSLLSSAASPWRMAPFLSGALLLWLVGGMTGCQQGEKPAVVEGALDTSGLVATVAGQPIARRELEEALVREQKARAGAALTASQREQVLERIIREKVLLARARAAGLDREPEMVQRWERMLAARYEALHGPEAHPAPAPTGADVEEYYRAHPEQFTTPGRIRIGLIQLKGSPKATLEKHAELRARAGQLLTLARASGTDFADLARQYSDDRASRFAGGDSGWLEPGQAPAHWPAELAEAAFALEQPGALAPLVEAAGSCYLVKLLERQPERARPLVDVRERIAHQLREQQRAALAERFHAEQRAGLAIEIHPAAVAAVPLPEALPAKTPGAAPSLPAR